MKDLSIQFIGQKKENQTKYEIGDLVRTADLKKTLSKSDTTNWSYDLFKITETINDTIASDRLDNVKERYNFESLLKSFEKDRVNNERKK